MRGSLGRGMKTRSPLWLGVLSLLLVAALFVPTPAFSQSCALCYTQAASSGARLIQALRNGIFVLIVPPLFMSVGITFLAYRKRNQFNDSESLYSDEEFQVQKEIDLEPNGND